MMKLNETQTYTVFRGTKKWVSGSLEKIVKHLKSHPLTDTGSSVLVFSDDTGKQMDFDLHRPEKEVLDRLRVYMAPSDSTAKSESGEFAGSGPGRPRLGVIAREVSLLPRHWEWLSTQSGGASATLRRLVEDAKKNLSSSDRVKQAQEKTHRFLSAIAGDMPFFEEALRSLYAKDRNKFKSKMESWPADIKKYASELSLEAFSSKE